ncbi:MAG: hybrid sensor histidine kinase/response regulator [candidate division Zixibacteria bacterium]|nr:hybrid sensor histidine kinase/response regulator [candidate division Zixibacteria bacterium]
MTAFIELYTSVIMQWVFVSDANQIFAGFDVNGMFPFDCIGYIKMPAYILLMAAIFDTSVIFTALKKIKIPNRSSSKTNSQSIKTKLTETEASSFGKSTANQTEDYYDRFEDVVDNNEILKNNSYAPSFSINTPQNIELLEQLERMNKITRIIKYISSTLDIDELFSKLISSLTEIAGFHWAAVVFTDDMEPWESKWKLPDIKSMEKYLRKSIGKPAPVYYRINKLELAPSLRAYFNKMNITNAAVSPIGGDIKARGFLLVGSSNPDGFNSHDDFMLKDILQVLDAAATNASIHSNIKKAYRSLVETRERLIQDEKFKALGEVAAGIAHDFKNILSAIMGRAQILLKINEGAKNISNDVLVKGLETIEKSAFDGIEIISRINESTHNRIKSQLVYINLREIINDTIEMTRPKWENKDAGKNITIKTKFKTEPIIRANRHEMVRVFSNLLLNAVEAIETDGVIEIKVLMESDKAVIYFSDNGSGMNEQTVKMIFDPYYTTKGKMGTGLGLSIVYTIITRYKGEIIVNSAPGKGTTFQITIPCQQDAHTQAKISVLIVEDDVNLRNVLHDIIIEISGDVYTAGSYNEANRILMERPFDMVLTDLGLPDEDGWKVIDKAKYYSPDSLIIPMTGWQKEIDKEEITSRGLTEVLLKPFKIEQVQQLIQRAIIRYKNVLRV